MHLKDYAKELSIVQLQIGFYDSFIFKDTVIVLVALMEWLKIKRFEKYWSRRNYQALRCFKLI